MSHSWAWAREKLPARPLKADQNWRKFLMATAAVKPEAESKEPKSKLPEISTESITKMARGISGYSNHNAEDRSGNMATGLGCTMCGFTGTSNISSLEDALAIRLAARTKNPHAVYVILNLARVGDTEYYKRDEEILGLLIAAGWKALEIMPGAHSGSNPHATQSWSSSNEYTSYLMGARAASDKQHLEEMWLEELKTKGEKVLVPIEKEKKSGTSKSKESNKD